MVSNNEELIGIETNESRIFEYGPKKSNRLCVGAGILKGLFTPPTIAQALITYVG